MKNKLLFLVILILLPTISFAAFSFNSSGSGKKITATISNLTPKGVYSPATTYAANDVAIYNGQTWWAIQASTGQTPTSNSLYWMLPPTGTTGATGPQGPQGIQGTQGNQGSHGIKGNDGEGVSLGTNGTYGWLTDSNTSAYSECASGKYGLNFVGGVLYQCSDGTNSVFTSGDSLPTQTGNSGKYLTTNGTTASWGTIAAGSGIAISTAIPTDAGAASLNDSTHVLTVASPTGYTQFTGSFTAWDTTPDAFSFTDETDVALSTAKTSNAITVAGINYPAAISVTGDTGFGYSKNSAACTATSGTVVAGDTVAACVTSSGSNSTATTATITIGGVSDTYSVTTAAGVSYTYPGTFGATDFTTPTGNNPSSVAVSSAITATTSGNISEIGVYLTGVAATECKIALFNGSSGTSSALTAGQTFSPATGWNDVAITPYSINNGTTIQAAMECNGTFNAGKNTSQSLGRYASALTYSNFPVTTTFFNVDGTNTNGFRIKVQQ